MLFWMVASPNVVSASLRMGGTEVTAIVMEFFPTRASTLQLVRVDYNDRAGQSPFTPANLKMVNIREREPAGWIIVDAVICSSLLTGDPPAEIHVNLLGPARTAEK
jgi:hypothetical protein